MKTLSVLLAHAVLIVLAISMSGILAFADITPRVKGNWKARDVGNVNSSRDAAACHKGKPDRMIKGCSALIKKGRLGKKDLSVAYNNRGVAHRAKGNLDRAIADYSKAISLNPKYENAYYNRGNVYRDNGDFDRAIADYDKAVILNPKFTEAYFNRGNAYRDKGNLDRAIADYSKAISLNPKYGYSYFGRGNAHLDKGDFNRAIADYDKALKFNPKYASAYHNRGLAYHKKGNLDRAIADYDQAIKLNPKHADAYNNRGIALRAKGNLDRAIADYNKAIKLNPKLTISYVNRGNAHLDKGDFNRAIADYDKAVKLDPKSASAYKNRGTAHADKGNHDRAIADYDKAVILNPKFTEAYFNRGNAYRDKGNLDQAIADYDKAINLDPKYGYSYFGRGNSYDQKRQYKLALADFRQALAHIPSTDEWHPKASVRITEIEQKIAATKQQAVKPSPSIKPRNVPTSGNRLALVIGNNAYQHMPSLDNPANDARDMSAALKRFGFQVILAVDANRAEMEGKIVEFAKAARNADTSLVFYAGHGIQHEGVNYLVPTDGQLEDATDLRRFIRLRTVIGDLQSSEGARILIVDACRDNEAVKRLADKTRSTAFKQGLATEKAAGVLIAFATQPGKIAQDAGNGRNSPFTEAILKRIETPNIDIRVMLARVRSDVLKATNGKQRPETADSMIGEFAFKKK